MTDWTVFWICVVAWIGMGIAAFGYFHYWMSKTYPDIHKIEEDEMLSFELMMAILAGPINWVAIGVIIDTYEKDKDDEDGMEV